MPSPFLSHGPTAEVDSLAIIHVRRDNLMPVVLKSRDDQDEGYSEGKVTNTRYGSFPHSTLIGKPWGSQVIASKVDTGSRGRRKDRRPKQAAPATLVAGQKRKSEDLDSSPVTNDGNNNGEPAQKEAVAAASGFIHLLRPTPEAWTASLPHRTQVVYTPDYSYILHRMQVRPGSTIIEAGAGSGSFTHAAARAVFNGYPSSHPEAKRRRYGKVCSFEFHEQRAQKVREEIEAHGLGEVVQVNHRDVYHDGFLLGEPTTRESPKADAIFLDLPSPWLALKHLVREPEDGSVSPLNPSTPVHICTFSPCLEQAQQTISSLRQHSWLSISMVEVAHRQIEVRREKYGVDAEMKRAVFEPRNVDEVVNRLRSLESRTTDFRLAQADSGVDTPVSDSEMGNKKADLSEPMEDYPPSPRSKNPVPAYKQGNLIHRTEAEIRTHTSYLTFAILPCSWSEEEEQKCREKWPSRGRQANANGETKKSKKQMKQEGRQRRTAKVEVENTAEAVGEIGSKQ
jgi:tRNA (adenine57-N1/adenine58-N1)-methyltransferase